MNRIIKQWKQLGDREKIAFLILMPLLAVAVVDFIWVQPMAKQTKAVRSETVSLAAENGRLAEQVAKVQQTLASSGSVESLQTKVDTLSAQVASQKSKIRQLTNALIPPERMASVLHDVLKRRGKLQVVSLRNLPAEPLQPAVVESDDDERNKDNEAALVYLHAIELVLRGRYADIKAYVSDLENSEHHFIWDGLHYEVKRYPFAEVRLTLASLSDRPFLMGMSEAEERANALD